MANKHWGRGKMKKGNAESIQYIEVKKKMTLVCNLWHLVKYYIMILLSVCMRSETLRL